jgi:2-methoxy-6-polyprenyl-1,4-benzoquinol methylase
MASKSYIRPLLRATKRQLQTAPTSRCFSTSIRSRAEVPQSTNHEKTTHFGFETVAEAEKEARGT